MFLPRVEVHDAKQPLRRHFNIIMYRNVMLKARGSTLEFEVNYKNKVVYYLVEVALFNGHLKLQ
jgi:hypothetical protein